MPRQIVYLELPFIGHATGSLRRELLLLVNRFYPQIDPKLYFKNNFSIGSLLKKRRTTNMLMRSSVVYKYTCDCCQQSYIGSTTLQLFRRSAQYKGVSFRTDTRLTKPDNSAIRDHCLNLDHRFDSSNFEVIGSSFYDRDLRILEAIFIKTQKSGLNNYQNSLALNILE